MCTLGILIHHRTFCVLCVCMCVCISCIGALESYCFHFRWQVQRGRRSVLMVVMVVKLLLLLHHRRLRKQLCAALIRERTPSGTPCCPRAWRAALSAITDRVVTQRHRWGLPLRTALSAGNRCLSSSPSPHRLTSCIRLNSILVFRSNSQPSHSLLLSDALSFRLLGVILILNHNDDKWSANWWKNQSTIIVTAWRTCIQRHCTFLCALFASCHSHVRSSSAFSFYSLSSSSRRLTSSQLQNLRLRAHIRT